MFVKKKLAKVKSYLLLKSANTVLVLLKQTVVSRKCTKMGHPKCNEPGGKPASLAFVQKQNKDLQVCFWSSQLTGKLKTLTEEAMNC